MLCYLWNIRGKRDLRETLYLAHLIRDSHRGVKVVRRNEYSEMVRTRRQVRHLAFKRPFGDLHDKWTPPNRPEELNPLVRLIKLDPSQLATWYVQKLIRQIHDWRFQGDDLEVEEAQKFARKIGGALALALQRGRPRVRVEPSQTKQDHREVRRQLAPIWIEHLADRGESFRERIHREFPGVNLALKNGEPGIPPIDYLQSYKATPYSVARFITADNLGISEGTVRRHLKRKHPTV